MAKDKEWENNKGEWTELYVLLKLLAQGAVQAIDEKMEKIENIYYPINKIMRREQGEQIDYVIQGNRVMIVGPSSEEIMAIDRSVLAEQAEFLLKEIRKKRNNDNGGKFKVPKVEEFAKKIKVTALKAGSNEANDIFMQIDDTHSSHDLGFSIKSFIGNAPTLFNASQTTNFVYKVKETEKWSDEQIKKINEIEGENKINNRMNEIKENGGKLSFVETYGEYRETFKNNLAMIDSDMLKMFADMLLHFYCKKADDKEDIRKWKTLLKNMREDGLVEDTALYEYKLKKFLCTCALGMTSATLWDGLDEVNGGCIFVTKDGNILAYRIYNRNAFEQYLLDNTKLAAPSTKNKYMELYKEKATWLNVKKNF